nr:DUF4363 family protein [uncultured Dysosmobacter sp.]
MKRGLLLPLAVLTALLAFSLWNAQHMAQETARFQIQLQQADALAQAENWPQTRAVLQESYRDWSRCQTYLHIVTEHSAVDDAEAMYRRAMAFAATEEITEFRAETADLTDQLRLLGEMERLSLRNIL